jgi:hypothetical protein
MGITRGNKIGGAERERTVWIGAEGRTGFVGIQGLISD